MGKSETAKMFAAAGCPVFDADETVHAFYAEPSLVAAIVARFPGTVRDGRVDRAALAAALQDNPDGFRVLESIVHPRVAAAQRRFLVASAGARCVVLNIPLLYETGWASVCNAVAVVSAPAAIQRARVLARPGMTMEKFCLVLSRQLPDVEKRRLADFVIDSSRGFDHARAQVAQILASLQNG